jgi:urease accessory protein
MTTLHCHSVERSTSVDSLPDHADTITLDETDRHRRRFAMVSDNGIEFLLNLSAATLLRENDILRLSDGRTIRVIAKPEPLYAVRGRDGMHLLNLTWHVGNRHLATQIMNDHILIRRDPVIRTMLEELGASIEEVAAGFNPAGGAYDHDHEAPHTHHEHSH